MKTKIIVLLFISLTLFSACSREKETMLIGVVGTMTGANSDLAVSGRRGVEIAVDEFNSSGGINGKKIELRIKDDKNDKERSLSVDKEFEDEGVKFIIGHYTSGVQSGVIDYINKQDILFLSPTVSADSLNAIDDNFIRFIAVTKEQATVLAKAADKNGHKKFAIFTDSKNKAFNDPLKDKFSELLIGNDGKVLVELEYDSSSIESIVSLVDELYKYDLDAVFMIGDSSSNSKFAQLAQAKGLNLNLYAPLWSNTSELIEKGGSAIDGMHIVGIIDKKSELRSYLDFEKKYVDMYGEEPSFSSLYSYEAAITLFGTLSKTKDHSPQNIKKMIIDKGTFVGVQGTFKIDEYGDNTREYMIFRIKNGKMMKIKF